MGSIHRIRQGEPGLPVIFDGQKIGGSTGNVLATHSEVADCICDIASLKCAMWTQHKLRKATRLVCARCLARTRISPIFAP